MSYRIGVDIGGTFTDLVLLDEQSGEIVSTKALTTPDELARGILSCLDQVQADLSRTILLVHGTTIGVNALIERKGARTALLTTAGFRDVLELGRGDYKTLHNLLYRRAPSLVPRSLRLEATERLLSDGSVHVPLDEASVERAARAMADAGVASVAIVFLFAYLNPAHEAAAAAIVRRVLPQASVTVSHDISREWREYERTNTTVVNAYVQPIMERYLGVFDRALRERGFTGDLLVTESNGGACSVEIALKRPVHTLESGPAAGAVGCAAIGRHLDNERLISFDMGGTTAKCCIVEGGAPRITDEYLVDGQPIRIPVIDIAEVSAGGGSIASIDAGGALLVGPTSAGARPGPVCYGNGGTEPTVTDANVLAGRIGGDGFLGGSMRLGRDLAEAAIRRRIAEPLGMTAMAAATGILRLAEVKMALAVKSVTTERGIDPRDHALVAYGGSGPLHAVAIARELSIGKAVIPPFPSTFSALGMLAADLRHDLVRTLLRPLLSTDAAWARATFAEMEAELRAELPGVVDPAIACAVDLRYGGQKHTVRLEVDAEFDTARLRGRFDLAHEQIYGYAAPEIEVELLNLRLTGTVPVQSPRMPPLAPSGRSAPVAPVRLRPIYSTVRGATVETGVYDRPALRAGDRIEGPAAIEEAATTTYIDVGDTLLVDALGFLVIDVAPPAGRAAVRAATALPVEPALSP